MLLEWWSAEAPELKRGVVGGLMPVRCKEVGQRLPESCVSGPEEEEPGESSLMSRFLAPHLHRLPPKLICMFSVHSCHRCSED